MPNDTDQAYYRRRELDARLLADKATDPAICRIHLDLVKLYGEMSRGVMEVPHRTIEHAGSSSSDTGTDVEVSPAISMPQDLGRGYYRRREKEERTLAEQATTSETHKMHLDLAHLYADLQNEKPD